MLDLIGAEPRRRDKLVAVADRGGRGASPSVPTVLFTDVVDMAENAAAGRHERRDGTRSHVEVVRSAVRTHGGREATASTDGLVATFTSPTKAITCALTIVGEAARIGVQARVGLHTGEVQRRGRSVSGAGVDVAAQVTARAAAFEVLVSDVVRASESFPELELSPRGSLTLKGIGGRRRIYAVSSAGVTPIRLILADDHPLWRDTLKGLLEHGGLASVVAEAGTGDEAVRVAETVPADVVLMDIDMPGRDGIDAARAITEMDGGPKVLMLSSLKERDEVVASLRAGACGYVLKTAGRDEVADAVRRVHGGELAFPPELAPIVLAELRAPGGATTAASKGGGMASLTSRERDVLGLIADGASNQAIAARLHLSAKTVEAHIGAIFTKLGLEPNIDQHRRVQAAVRFLTEPGSQRRS